MKIFREARNFYESFYRVQRQPLVSYCYMHMYAEVEMTVGKGNKTKLIICEEERFDLSLLTNTLQRLSNKNKLYKEKIYY